MNYTANAISKLELATCPYVFSMSVKLEAQELCIANSVYFFGRLVLGDLEERNLTYKDGNLYQEGQFINKKTNGKGSLVHLDSRKFENQLLE